MKNLLLISVSLCTLFSCKKDELVKEESYPQTWQLVRMTGQIPNSEQTGAAMTWQESYVLQADGTFKKTRRQSDQTLEASGTYSFQDLSDGKYLVLVYAADNSIIGNCTAELKEVLAVRADDTLAGTWQACDGPGLQYKKVE